LARRKKKGLISDELDPDHPDREDFMVRLAAQILSKPHREPEVLFKRAKTLLEQAEREARALGIEVKPAQKTASGAKPESEGRKRER